MLSISKGSDGEELARRRYLYGFPPVLEWGNGRCVVTGEISPGNRPSACQEFNVSEHSLQEESYSISKTSVDCLILHKTQGEKKWVAPILDHILQDQSLDHSLVLDQDQDHTQGRRDTVLGLVPGRIQDLVVEIEFILEIIVEITEIIEE